MLRPSSVPLGSGAGIGKIGRGPHSLPHRTSRSSAKTRTASAAMTRLIPVDSVGDTGGLIQPRPRQPNIALSRSASARENGGSRLKGLSLLL